MAAEPCRVRGRPGVRRQEPLRPLPRAASGVDDREPVEVAADARAGRRSRAPRSPPAAGRAPASSSTSVIPLNADGRVSILRPCSARALAEGPRPPDRRHAPALREGDGRAPRRRCALDTKERYFAVLSVLVAKLEASDKPMRDIMQEMMAEAATVILQELQG